MCARADLLAAHTSPSHCHRLFNSREFRYCPKIARHNVLHLWLFVSLNSYCFQYEILHFFFFWVDQTWNKKSILSASSSLACAFAFWMVYFHLRPFNLKHLQSNNNNKMRQHMRILHSERIFEQFYVKFRVYSIVRTHSWRLKALIVRLCW